VTDEESKPPRRRWWKYFLVLVVLGLLLMVAAAWYMTTESFQAFVRSHIVAALEKASGGRVELGTYHTVPFRLQAEIRDLTIHGTEGPNEIPLVHIDGVVARIRVISLLETQFGFKSIVLEHPVVHLIVRPDGSTNIPEPKVQRKSTETPIEQLFALSIRQLQIRRGEFVWNDQRTPFDFDGKDVSAEMRYSFLRGRYEGNLALGKVETKFQKYAPFAWSAAANFNLGKNDVEISSLKWNSGKSHLEASGHVRDFRNPTIEANYTGAVDLVQAAAILRQRQLRAGNLDFSGKGTWSADKFASEGFAALKNFEWRDNQLTLVDATLNSQFSVNNRELKLSKAQGRLLGGSITAEAEITNWLATPPARGAKQKKAEEQKGLLRLRIKDLYASAIAAAFSTRAYPLQRLKLAGTADGTVDARWIGSPQRGEAEFALSLNPPAKLQAGQIPITAHTRGRYRAVNDELELAQFDAATRSTQVHASGKLAATSSLQLSAATSDLAELHPIIVALQGPARLPINLHGSAHFNGFASGKVSSATLNGHLQIQDFDSIIPATAGASEQELHWDSLSADIQLSPRNVAVRHAIAVRGDTSARFDVSASLSRGQFNPTDSFTATLNLQNADIPTMQAIAGYHYPVTGRANVSLQASGTRAQPHAEGHIQVANAVFYGQPVRLFTSDVRYNQGLASLNNIHLDYYESQASGGASYDVNTHNYRFNLTGQNFDLARISHLQSTRVTVEGKVDFTAQGSGTLEAPVVDAKILIRDLTLDQERVGNLNLAAVTQGNLIRLTATSDFEHAQFNIEGTVEPRQDFLADLKLHFDHLDLDPVFREYVNGRISGHSALTGDVQLRGALRRPREMNLAASFEGFDVTIDEVQLKNDGPIRVSVSQQMARLEQLHIVGENTDFSAHGTASLATGHDLDLAAKGHLNLQLLQALNHNVNSSGSVDISLNVTGPASDPLLQGRVDISHGSLNYADLPSGLSDMNGALIFNKNRLQIESLTARSGGGTLTLTGGATTYQGQINFDFSASAQDVRLRYPQGVSSTANAELHFFGTRDASTLTGDVNITKLAITPGFDFASYASSSAQSVVVPPATSPLYRVKLDVHVTTAPDLQMQTAIARLSGDADLRLRGTAAKPALLGRVEILEGDINFNGAEYRLERGEILFQSPVSIKPVLDLQATTRVRDYDITVSVNGDTSKPLSVKYRSDPPLPEADIVALLAVGQTREQSAQMAQSGSAFSQTASNLILSEALNATVSNRVQRLLGISKIKIDPQGLSTETNPTRGAQVTIEQQIANNFTLTYSQNVSQASQQIIQGEYYVRKNVSIVGTRDQNGVLSFDIKIRQRKK
jgi:translocation and assembly module TamB